MYNSSKTNNLRLKQGPILQPTERNMNTKTHGYAASAAKGLLQPFEFDLGELGPEEVEIKVTHCGICHSDLSLVLEAFDTLFNKRDYVAAQPYLSSNYIQHSRHIAPGRQRQF